MFYSVKKAGSKEVKTQVIQYINSYNIYVDEVNTQTVLKAYHYAINLASDFLKGYDSIKIFLPDGEYVIDQTIDLSGKRNNKLPVIITSGAENPVINDRCFGQEYDERIQQILIYIADHLNENLSVRKLAQKVPMSVSHFNRVFRKYTGDSPYAYVMAMRIKKAKYLLRNTELTLIAISDETGFNSEANFIYYFTKNVGVSPGKFRKLKKENAV